MLYVFVVFFNSFANDRADDASPIQFHFTALNSVKLKLFTPVNCMHALQYTPSLFTHFHECFLSPLYSSPPPPPPKLIHTHNQKIEVTTVSLAHLLWLVLVEFWTESSLWWLHWHDTLSLWESFLVHLAPWPRLLLHLLSTRQMASPAAGLFRKGCGDQWSAQERPDKQSKETTPKH